MRSHGAAAFLILSALLIALPTVGTSQVQISARAARITIGGRLHTQFTTASVDSADSQFFFRRARLQADIRVTDYLDGRLEYDFASGRSGLQDAFARVTVDPALALSVGQFKRPFTLWDLHSANDLPIIERDGAVPPGQGPGERCRGVGGVCNLSRLTQQLQFDGRDIGLRLEGNVDALRYMASLTNGQGTNQNDVNDAKSASGRVEVAVESIRLGVFGALHDYRDPIPAVDDDDFAEAFGADIEVGSFRDGFHLIAGGVMGNNWRLGPDVDFLTGQVLASYYVEIAEEMLAGVEPMFRASWADPDRDDEDDEGLLLTPGLMFYFQGRNGLAANFDHYSPDGPADAEWSLKLQLFLYF
jgi:hypothetical protein